ncbi:MAG: hypothetical protein LBD74_02635 [Spirochaetaceae bacterium]|jgi:hypothetical protein|nr:hypothetical protein [Spirochaetaceae bacterium]
MPQKSIKRYEMSFFVPLGLFILYFLLSGLAIMGFQFLFPRELPPLPIYTYTWNLIQGFLSICNLFPALAMTGLILPYGIFSARHQEPAPRHTGRLASFRIPIYIAIGATVLYGFLVFLAFPHARKVEDYLQSQGQLFTLSKEKAQIHAAMQEWPEASQFIALCERIWPESPEISDLRVEATISMEEWQTAQANARREAIREFQQTFKEGVDLYTGLPGQRQPINAPEALAMAAVRLRDERYYDAHWLGLLATRIGPQGSKSAIQGTEIARQAWDALGKLEPHSQELYAYALYHQKRQGYEAMLAGDWITAYYMFREFFDKNPGDPDVAKFLILSEQGVQVQAFFSDEITLSVGAALPLRIFSLPLEDGRMIVRIPWFWGFESISYGRDIEIMALEQDGSLRYHLTAPYAQIVPLEGEEGSQVMVKMLALDRQSARQYRPIWIHQDPDQMGATQVVLDVSYRDFLLLAKLSEGMDSLSIADLFRTVENIQSYGYIPKVFQAEIVYRLSEPTLFLPIAIVCIVLGARYRARRRAWQIFPMLVILPVVCYGIGLIYLSILNTLGIWSVIFLGFPFSLGLFTLGPLIVLVVSLLYLAAQPTASGASVNSAP